MDILVIIQSAWTVIVMVLFLGIAAWAYNSRNQAMFDEAASIPLDDDDSVDAHKHN